MIGMLGMRRLETGDSKYEESLIVPDHVAVWLLLDLRGLSEYDLHWRRVMVVLLGSLPWFSLAVM